MRRFVAFIIMALSLIMVVTFNMQFNLEKLNYGLEFSGGYEVVYRVDPDDVNNFDVSVASDAVSNRLELAGVRNSRVDSEYDVDEGYYQVRVVLTPSNTVNLENILRSVETTKELTVCTYGDRCEEDIIDRDNVNVIYNEGVPSIVIGLKDTAAFKSLIEHSSENTTVEEAENNLVIWMDKDDLDTYEEAMEDNFEALKMREKIVSIVTIITGTNFNEDEATFTIDTYGYDKTSFNSSEVAHSYQRVLSASEENFTLKRLYQHSVTASYGAESVQKVLVSIGIALLVLVIYLVYSYGSAGLVGFISLLSSLFVDVVLFNLLGFQLSPAIMIGFVAVIACSLIYLITCYERFKNELKKGRNPSKALSEALKRSKSTAIDASLLLFLVGLVTYFVARQQLKYFSLFIIVGSLVTLVFNTLLNKWLLYWLCNSSFASKHIGQFRVKVADDNAEVTHDANEEKEKKVPSFMVNRKRNSLIAGGLTVLSVAAILLMGVFTTHFNYTDDFSTKGRVDIITYNVDIFEVKQDVEDFFEASDLKLTPTSVSIVVQNDPDQEEEVEMSYITAQFDFTITDEAMIEKIKDKMADLDVDAEVYVSVTTPTVPQNTFNSSLILLGVTIAMATAYMLVRFGLKYGLASAGVLIAEGSVSLGILALTRVAVNSYTVVGIIGGVALTAMLLVPLIEMIKQMTREYKVKVTTYDQKEEITLKAFDIFNNHLYVYAIAILFMIVFLLALSPSSMSSLYSSVAISLLLGIIAILYLLIPFYMFFVKNFKYRRFKKMSARVEEKRKAKEQKKRRNPGSEPQEAIIPGIND